MRNRILLLVTSLMVSVAAFAQWTKPAPPKAATWEAETEFYLYNVEENAWFINHQGSGAPLWGTAATVNGTLGTTVMFTRSNPDATWAQDEIDLGLWDSASDNTYLLVSYVTSKKANLCSFTDGWTWTDNNSNPNRFYNINLNGDGTFQIEGNNVLNTLAGSTVDGDIWTGNPLGVAPNDGDRKVVVSSDKAVVTSINWYCVTPEDYEAYIAVAQEQIAAYEAAGKLDAAIQDLLAEFPSADVAAQKAVYENYNVSTVEQLNQAIEEIGALYKQLLKEQAESSASVDNPKDMSSVIVNGTFDVIGDFNGWTGGFGAGGVKGPSAEVYGKAFDVYQKITGLPAGVYKVLANGYTRKTDANTSFNLYKQGTLSETFLYAQASVSGLSTARVKNIAAGAEEYSIDYTDMSDGAESVVNYEGTDYYMPNHMLSADSYFHNEDGTMNPRYENMVMTTVGEDGELTIGVKNSVGGGSDWSIFDDFRLIYLGKGDDAYALLKDEMIEELTVELGDEDYYGAPEKTLYDNAMTALKDANGLDIFTAHGEALVAYDSLFVSKENYAAYIAKVEEAKTWLEEAENDGVDLETEAVALLADYLQMDAVDGDPELDGGAYPNGASNYIINLENDEHEGRLSAAAIAEETEYLDAMVNEANRQGLREGSVLTNLLVNPDFKDPNGKGWTFKLNDGVTAKNPHGGLVNEFPCAEVYGGWADNAGFLFDVYQDLENLPNGLYEISANCFYRWADNGQFTGEEVIPAVIYMNDYTTPVQHIASEAKDSQPNNGWVENTGIGFVPNSMDAASEAFRDGMYKQVCYGMITDGKMRIGIKKETKTVENRHWCLFTNFQLRYMAKNEDALASVIESYVDREEALRSSEDADNISANAGVALVEAREAALASIAPGNGDAMYDALNAFVAAYNEAEATVVANKELEEALVELQSAIDLYDGKATEEAIEKATDVYDEGEAALRQESSEVLNGILADVADAMAELKVPALNADASLDNPQPMQEVIVNPTFDNETYEGWEGSSFGKGGATAPIAERYDMTFDTYQDIVVPAGYYRVSATAGIRKGQAAESLAAFQADEQTNAVIYAVTSEGESSKFVKNICIVGDETPERWTVNAGGEHNPYYIPNTMADMNPLYNDDEIDDITENKFYVSVIVKVGEDRKLRIGAKTLGDKLGGQWFTCDNFNLEYIGQEGTVSPDEATPVVGIESSSIVAKGIFTLAGQKVAAPVKGLYIINGKKVLVK